MSLRRKRLMWLLGLAASITAFGLDKDKEKFTPPPLSAINGKVTENGVTVAAIAYDSGTETPAAFGKLNPNQFGVLPVLLIVQNDSKQAVTLDSMKVEYIDRDRSRIDATPSSEVKYLYGPRRPNFSPSPLPTIGIGRKKNPLEAHEIETRAFAAKMLPPGESAHGFVYFQANHRGAAKLYVTGLVEAATKKELLYYEVPLD